ncbi:unnamed protein product [Urochloa humidicola]
MEPRCQCPPWIDPGNAFRIVVKCEKYKAITEYGVLDMAEQIHDVWVDRCSGYNLDNFLTDMASKIIWGPSQTLSLWSVDTDSAAKWKIRRNEHFQKMIQSRVSEKFAEVIVEVVNKEGYQQENEHEHVQSTTGSVGSSGVTNVPHAVFPPSYGEGGGETFSSQQPAEAIYDQLDWSTLTIIPNVDQDGEAYILADEDQVFEAMGFKEADERAEQVAREEAPIPCIPAELQEDMSDVGLNVDDSASA